MLFCCLWRNVETSCHKHFVVVSRHQQTPPLTTSDKCHNLPRSGGTVLITSSRSQRWQHAVKPDIGSESQFPPTPPAFDASLKGPSRNIAVTFGMEKLEWREDTITRFDRIHERDGRTDGQRDRRTDTAWRQLYTLLLPLSVSPSHIPVPTTSHSGMQSNPLRVTSS